MDGWKKTNQGKILVWRDSEKKVVIKKKFSEDQVKDILTLREENNELSQKDFIKKIELENDIKVSVSTLKKMIDSIY